MHERRRHRLVVVVVVVVAVAVAVVTAFAIKLHTTDLVACCRSSGESENPEYGSDNRRRDTIVQFGRMLLVLFSWRFVSIPRV